MVTEQPNLDQKLFLQRYGFTKKQFTETGLEWTTLENIYSTHGSDLPRLQTTADYVSQRLREISAVHSLKVRIKHPEHLIAKIIRKKIETPDLMVDVDNYSQHITDLIGIRALHLFKGEWRPIHDFVTSTWELQEPPIAYVRDGDPGAIEKDFTDSGCSVRKHGFGYRSVHYLIKLQPAKQLHLVELQVRTLFEEGWSEIDHQIRYPNLTSNPHLAEFLTIFNRLAGSADEMGTFIKALSKYVGEQEKRVSEFDAQLRKAISELNISNAEKEKLQAQVENLRKSSQQPFSFAPELSFPYNTTVLPTMVGHGTSFSDRAWNAFTGVIERTCMQCGKTFMGDLTTTMSVQFLCPDCRKKSP